MAYTWVLLSNISDIATRTGRLATMPLRYGRAEQKAAQALVQTANCSKAAL